VAACAYRSPVTCHAEAREPFFPPMGDVPTQTRAFTAAASLRSSLCRTLSTALPSSPDALRLRLRHLLQLVFQVRRQWRCVHDKVPEPPETMPDLVESSVQHAHACFVPS
jgi:hypothetical protein